MATNAETIATALMEEGECIRDLSDNELQASIDTFGLDCTVADLRATMYRLEAENEQHEEQEA